MSKIHIVAIDFGKRHSLQTDKEYYNQTMCGYVRDNVTYDSTEATCFYCKRAFEVIK